MLPMRKCSQNKLSMQQMRNQKEIALHRMRYMHRIIQVPIL